MGNRLGDWPKWRPGDGEPWWEGRGGRVLVKDMSNDYLLAAIRWADKVAQRHHSEALSWANPFSEDSVAGFDFDNQQMSLLEDGPDPTLHYPVYDKLVEEALKRGLAWESR